MNTGLLYWAFIFLIMALVSAAFGFGIISDMSYTIAKWLAMAFAILFVISVVAHFARKA